MLLQFASARLRNYRGGNAKGAHVLKGDQSWFRGSLSDWQLPIRPSPVLRCPGCRDAAVQGYLPPHTAVVIGQGAKSLY